MWTGGFKSILLIFESSFELLDFSWRILDEILYDLRLAEDLCNYSKLTGHILHF